MLAAEMWDLFSRILCEPGPVCSERSLTIMNFQKDACHEAASYSGLILAHVSHQTLLIEEMTL